MKVGDRVYCKSTRYDGKDNVVNRVGCVYVIERVDKISVWISNELNKSDWFFYSLNYRSGLHDYDYYFLSDKEFRKLKLEMLEVVSSRIE